MGGLAISTVLTTGAAWAVFDIPPLFSLLAIGLSSVLAMIAVRSTGETDINPIGGMGKVTQLVFGGLAPGAMTTNLMAAAITGSGASQAGDMMQDLKTGYLLGASPRGQFKAQLVGIAAGVFFCVPIYMLFDSAYEIGGEEIPAPAAHAWKAMAELLSKGFDAMPNYAVYAVAAGAVFGVVMAVTNKLGPKSLTRFLPSGLAFGIAFIVPAYYSVAMFVGALMYLGWQKSNKSDAEQLGFSVASGLIAGEGLMGIVAAGLTLAGLDSDWFMGLIGMGG
jgi:OPT family oligopeptide transporter